MTTRLVRSIEMILWTLIICLFLGMWGGMKLFRPELAENRDPAIAKHMCFTNGGLDRILSTTNTFDVLVCKNGTMFHYDSDGYHRLHHVTGVIK